MTTALLMLGSITHTEAAAVPDVRSMHECKSIYLRYTIYKFCTE